MLLNPRPVTQEAGYPNETQHVEGVVVTVKDAAALALENVAEGGENELTAHELVFSHTVGPDTAEPLTVTFIAAITGDAVVATVNGIITEVPEAVPAVAPEKLTGVDEDTAQVQPAEVKLIVRVPFPPPGKNRK